MGDERPTHLDLFSGIGGFALAAKWAGFRTIGFCEIDPYCQRVLAKNFLANTEHSGCQGSRQHEIADGRKANATPSRCEIWPDIFKLDGTLYRGVTLITGGFPCQPFSVAGKRRGAADDRAIWPEMFRVIREARPAWLLGENVPGIIAMELDNVLLDLEGIGYACRTFVIPACAVDARHRRDRIWVVGRRIIPDPDESGSQGRDSAKLPECAGQRAARTSSSPVAYAAEQPKRESTEQTYPVTDEWRTWVESGGDGEHCRWPDEQQWFPQSSIRRVANGIPSRVHRLKSLGNAIVPQVAYQILKEIRNQL